MDRVFRLQEKPFGKPLFAAVAIGESAEDQRHIGILHGEEDTEPSFLHLAWHCDLQNDVALPGYVSAWVETPAHRERLRQVAALCRRIWKTHEQGGIPYAFSEPESAFDERTGAFLLGPSRFGLTCASFVLAVFHTAGLPLAAYASWPSGRSGDRQWQEKVTEALRKRADEKHIQHVESEIGAVRYRPEEVAAAAACAPPPANLSAIEPIAADIVVMLQRRRAQ